MWIKPVSDLPQDANGLRYFSLVGKKEFGYGMSRSEQWKRWLLFAVLLGTLVVRIYQWKLHHVGRLGLFLPIVSLALLWLMIYAVMQKSRKKTDFFKGAAAQNRSKEFALGGRQFFFSTGEFMRTANNLRAYMRYGQSAYEMRARYLAVDLDRTRNVSWVDNELTIFSREQTEAPLIIKVGDSTQDALELSSMKEELAMVVSQDK